MLNVETLTVGEQSTNCYLVYDSVSKDGLVIDPGDEATFIEEKISHSRVAVKAVILTHGHYDHLLGALEISLAYNTPIFLNQKDNFLLKRASATANHFNKGADNLQPIATQELNNDTVFNIENIEISTIEIPGHTPGSVAIYLKHENILFCGDLIFSDGTFGDTSHHYSDKKMFLLSLKKILSLPPDLSVYSGHGEFFLLGDFQKRNL